MLLQISSFPFLATNGTLNLFYHLCLTFLSGPLEVYVFISSVGNYFVHADLYLFFQKFQIESFKYFP